MSKFNYTKMKSPRITSSEDFVVENEELVKHLIDVCDRYNVSYEKIVACIEDAYKDGTFNEAFAIRYLEELERDVCREGSRVDDNAPTHAELWNVAYDWVSSIINNFQKFLRGGRSVDETYREVILSYSKLLDYHQSEISKSNQQLKFLQDRVGELESEISGIKNENAELKKAKQSLENDLEKPKIEDRFHLLLKIIQRMIGYSGNSHLWGKDAAGATQEVEWFRDDVSQLERELIRNGLQVVKDAQGYEKFFIQVQDDKVQNPIVSEPLIMRGDNMIENGQINVPSLVDLSNTCSDTDRFEDVKK